MPQPVEQPLEFVELACAAAIGGEAAFEFTRFVGSCLAVEHRMHQFMSRE